MIILVSITINSEGKKIGSRDEYLNSKIQNGHVWQYLDGLPMAEADRVTVRTCRTGVVRVPPNHPGPSALLRERDRGNTLAGTRGTRSSVGRATYYRMCNYQNE